MPTLLVRGDAASLTDRAITDALAELVPSAQLLILPGGHTSHMTSMEPFLEAYAALITGASAPSR